MCKRERERERECVGMLERKYGYESERESVYEREKEEERERERERERQQLCVRLQLSSPIDQQFLIRQKAFFLVQSSYFTFCFVFHGWTRKQRKKT